MKLLILTNKHVVIQTRSYTNVVIQTRSYTKFVQHNLHNKIVQKAFNVILNYKNTQFRMHIQLPVQYRPLQTFTDSATDETKTSELHVGIYIMLCIF